MLFKELQKLIATIEFYDNKEGWRAFVEEVEKMNTSALKELRGFNLTGEEAKTLHWAKLAIGAGWYSRLIKPLPVVIEIMGEVIREKQGPVHDRTALAGALAYVVQRDIFFPGNHTGGGYNLIDDALILYYAYYRYLKNLAARVPELKPSMENYCDEIEALMRMGLRVFPSAGIKKLKSCISNIAMSFYHLQEVPSPILDQLTEQIIENPHENSLGKILSRLAYHLDVKFQTYDESVYSDPVLTMLNEMVSHAGNNPGEVASEGYYY